jgi:hypothetical protein
MKIRLILIPLLLLSLCACGANLKPDTKDSGAVGASLTIIDGAAVHGRAALATTQPDIAGASSDFDTIIAEVPKAVASNNAEAAAEASAVKSSNYWQNTYENSWVGGRTKWWLKFLAAMAIISVPVGLILFRYIPSIPSSVISGALTVIAHIFTFGFYILEWVVNKIISIIEGCFGKSTAPALTPPATPIKTVAAMADPIKSAATT